MEVEKRDVGTLVNRSLPNVSVVMAVHVGVQYGHFVQAIDSIIEQTLPDFEFVIVCDGELTIEQEAYLVSLEKNYSFVVVIRLGENVGPGAARNTGIKNSKGKYVAIMDSDDIALSYRLKRQFDYLEEHNDIAVVGGFCDVIDDDGVIAGTRKLPLSPESLRLYSLFFCPLNNPTVMGRRKVFESYMYDEKLRQGEDYRLWVKLLKANYKIANISDELIKFRVSSDLYKRRSGFHKGMSDIVNRLYAVQLSPVYLMPFVLLFAIGSFSVRFLPVGVIQFLTTSLERVRAKLID
ncbi:MAG: glycosyltransferase [Gammaproteobacteria bacterium]|nr:glycosyltransferase [Gammaproteobacteria bacterium]